MFHFGLNVSQNWKQNQQKNQNHSEQLFSHRVWFIVDVTRMNYWSFTQYIYCVCALAHHVQTESSFLKQTSPVFLFLLVSHICGYWRNRFLLGICETMRASPSSETERNHGSCADYTGFVRGSITPSSIFTFSVVCVERMKSYLISRSLHPHEPLSLSLLCPSLDFSFAISIVSLSSPSISVCLFASLSSYCSLKVRLWHWSMCSPHNEPTELRFACLSLFSLSQLDQDRIM